jgi:hypothetical protein
MRIQDIVNEADINIDLRPAQRAAMDKINPADFADERAYAKAAAAAGNTGGASAMQGLDLNNPASYAAYTKSAPEPTAAQRAEWSKDATADQQADWRNGKTPVATAKPVVPNNTVATATPVAEPETATQELASTEELQAQQTKLQNQYSTEYKKLQPYITASKKYDEAIAKVQALIKQTATDSPQYAQLVATMSTAVKGQKSLVDKMNPLVKKLKEIQAEYDSITAQTQTAQPQTESLDRILTIAGLR